MQIANGILILSPENQQPVYGVTPAEALILYKLHFKNSNGSPFRDFYIQEGEAQTEDVKAVAGESGWFNPLSGHQVPEKKAIEAVSHKRTNQEEISRLQRKYTGNISVAGGAKRAFDAVFGDGDLVTLPQTFDQLEKIKHLFTEKPAQTEALIKAESRRSDLSSKLRSDLVEIASNLGLKIHTQDTKESIVNGILTAEATPETIAE